MLIEDALASSKEDIPMPSSLKNRSLLSLVNHTPAEIDYLIELAADLKRAKRAGTEVRQLTGKSIALIFEKHLLVQEALLRLLPTIKAPTQPSLTRPSLRSAIKKVLKIPPVFSVLCMTPSNTEAFLRKLLKN